MPHTYSTKTGLLSQNAIITENIGVPTAMIDFGYAIEQVNAAWLAMLGLDTEGLMGKTLKDLPMFEALVHRIKIYLLIQGKEQLITETTVDNGKFRHITWQLTPVNIDGAYTAFVMTRHDDAQNAPSATATDIQSDLTKLYQNGPLGIVHTTIEGKILKVNPTFCAMVGYTEAELLRMTIADITVANGAQADYTARQAATNVQFKKKYVRKNGSQFWANLWLEFFKADEANTTTQQEYVIGIVEDIQEQEVASKVLQTLTTVQQTDREFLQKIVKNISHSLDVPCAAIVFFDDENEDKKMATMKAIFTNGQWEMERKEPLDNLPSKMVFDTNSAYFILDGLNQIYPNIYINTPQDAVGYAAVPITDAQTNSIIGAVSIIDSKPITEEKIIENALQIYANAVAMHYENQKKQDHYQILTDNITDFISLHDDQGNILYASDKCIEVAGYTPQELISTNPISYVYQNTQAEYEAQYQQIIKNKGNGYIQYQVAHKHTGNPVWIESIVRAFWDKNANAIRLACSTRDITKQKAADEKILQSQIHTKEIVDSIQDMGILSVNLRYEYTMMNTYHRNFSKMMTGIEPQIGVSIFDYTQNQDWIVRTKERLDKAFAGNAHSVLDDVSTQDEVRVFETFFYPSYSTKGDIIGATVVGRDISKRIKADKTIIQKETEVSKLNHELETFFYRTSHEFRAPLTSIEGLIDLMSLFPDETDNYKQKVNETIEQLKARTRNVARYAYNKQHRLAYSIVDFEAIMQVLNEDVAQKVYRIDKQMPRVVMDIKHEFCNDVERLKNIIYCIVANAYKFSKPKDPNFELKINITTTPTHATLVFGDNGQGIANAELPHIFDMFVRSNENSQGAGIGLYIVKETVATMGGTVSVASVLAQGTTFTITLPNQIPTPR
jgi:PAS domain S-box-containing protein